MAYCTSSCGSDFYHNLGNQVFRNSGPNKTRPLLTGNNTVLKWLSEQPDFSNFVSLIYIANLHEELDDINYDWTVFAPINNAFDERPELLATFNRGKARAIVFAHLTRSVPLCLSDIANEFYEVDNPIYKKITVDGRRLPFRVGVNSIGSGFGLEWDVVANMISHEEAITYNGVIHPIDKVIYPHCYQ